MTTKNIIFKIIIIAILIMNLTGCWNKRDLDELAIVTGIAIDKAEDPEQVKVTNQIINTSNVSMQEQGGSSPTEESYWNVESEGYTVFDATRKATYKSNRKLYSPHNQVIIISKELAEEGILQYLDLFMRDPEPRSNVWILISEGEASEVLEIESKLEEIPGLYISQLIETRYATSQTSAVTLHELLHRLNTKTIAPVTSIAKIDNSKGEPMIELKGTAVFKDDKMVGELDTLETRGLLWVIGEVKSGVIVIEAVEKKGHISMETFQSDSKIIPKIENNKVCITVEIQEEGKIGEMMVQEDISNPDILDQLNKRKAAAIYDEVMSAIFKAKKLNTDIFGFGEAVHRKYPKEWETLEGKWDDIFPNLDVEIKVNTNIRGAGSIGVFQ